MSFKQTLVIKCKGTDHFRCERCGLPIEDGRSYSVYGKLPGTDRIDVYMCTGCFKVAVQRGLLWLGLRGV